LSNKLFKRYKTLAAKAEKTLGTKESMEWFRRRIRKDKPIKSIDRVTEGRKLRTIEPGGMYTYAYDPKTKKQLPFYDLFPLIICLEIVRGGWYGVNLHYLPPAMRANVLYEIGYGKLPLPRIAKAISLDPRATPAMKRYLFDHCQTKPTYIPKDEWEIAIQLPFENFVKATAKQVWENSRSKV